MYYTKHLFLLSIEEAGPIILQVKVHLGDVQTKAKKKQSLLNVQLGPEILALMTREKV